MRGRKWTAEEIDYLVENIGIKSKIYIAKKLNRTPGAIKSKAQSLKIGNLIYNSERLTAAELSRAIHTDKKTIAYWINNKGLKCSRVKSYKKRKYYQIKISDFWEWAEKHKESIKWKNVELNILGKEPVWVHQARLNDLNRVKNKFEKWTKEEDAFLRDNYLRLSRKEISKRLNRTVNGVQARANALRIVRTIKLKWKQEEIDMLIKYKLKGYTDKKSAELLGRSYNSVRWKKAELIKQGKLKVAPATKLKNNLK